MGENPHMLGRRTVRPGRLGQAVVAVVLAGFAAQAAHAGDPGDILIDSVPEGSSNGLAYRSATFPAAATSQSVFAVAKCAKRKVLTGGGAFATGPAQDGRFLELGPNRISDIPTKPRKSFTAQFENTSANPADATSFSICARKKGLSMETKATPEPDSNAVVNAKARCPKGTSVTGGGLTSESNEEYILASAPYDGNDADSKPDDGWRTSVVTGIGQSDRQLRAHAFCSASFTLAYRSDTDTDVTLDGLAVADCPGRAAITGGGIAISGGAGAFVNTSAPVDLGDPGDVPDDAWQGFAGVTTGSRTLDVFAICRK
jgi:hypothetical protein